MGEVGAGDAGIGDVIELGLGGHIALEFEHALSGDLGIGPGQVGAALTADRAVFHIELLQGLVEQESGPLQQSLFQRPGGLHSGAPQHKGGAAGKAAEVDGGVGRVALGKIDILI